MDRGCHFLPKTTWRPPAPLPPCLERESCFSPTFFPPNQLTSQAGRHTTYPPITTVTVVWTAKSEEVEEKEAKRVKGGLDRRRGDRAGGIRAILAAMSGISRKKEHTHTHRPVESEVENKNDMTDLVHACMQKLGHGIWGSWPGQKIVGEWCHAPSIVTEGKKSQPIMIWESSSIS